MKRLILIAAFLLTAGALSAQNYIIVNSEKVFKSVEAYNTAISDLDSLAKQYQEQVDAKFDEVETLYNNYMAQKASLSASARQAREALILAREKEAQQFQESLFGQEGVLMQKRLELTCRFRNGCSRPSRRMPAGGRRSGARFVEQPHAALQQPFGGAYAAGDRGTEMKIRHQNN